MAHPEVENNTPFEFEPLFAADEDGRPIVTTIIKGTFAIGSDSTLSLLDPQPPVDFTGDHHGDPETSSLRHEPETAFMKPRTDVVLLGHAHAQTAHTTQLDVSLQVGPLHSTVRVTGDRHWEQGLLRPRMTAPRAFERIPLVYERAYGGWDTSDPDPAKHAWEPRNPVGVGFRRKGSPVLDGAPVPNLEDPYSQLTRYAGRSRPVGFGFVSPHWEPRASLAGTYDAHWQATRCPALPTDFDVRHLNAAPPDLTVPGYLRGDEPILATNVVPEGHLAFSLPGIAPPSCTVALRERGGEDLTTSLDTVIIDADERHLTLIWRSFTTLRDAPTDVESIEVHGDFAGWRPIRSDNVVPLFANGPS